MRTDYFLGQNRGDDYRNSIKSYSLQAWRDAGGEDGNEPYFEEDVQRRGLDYCPVIRVYVDARIFSTWEAWKAEAERAKLGAIKGKDIYGGLAFFGGVGYSFSGNPAFLVEDIPGYGTRIFFPCAALDFLGGIDTLGELGGSEYTPLPHTMLFCDKF